jgi:hypothetical protein
MDHHESATQCIKQVLDSNETAENDPDDDGDNDSTSNPEVIVPPEDTEATKRAKRLAEARALKESAKL